MALAASLCVFTNVVLLKRGVSAAHPGNTVYAVDPLAGNVSGTYTSLKCCTIPVTRATDWFMSTGCLDQDDDYNRAHHEMTVDVGPSGGESVSVDVTGLNTG